MAKEPFASDRLVKLLGVGRRFLRHKSGASAAEYALVLAIVGAAIAFAAYTIGDGLVERDRIVFENASASIDHDFSPGEGAFIKPDNMEVKSWYPIEFVAGPDRVAILAEAEDLPITNPREIFVSPNMRVDLLKDPNFEIRRKSSTLQELGPDLTATWQWDVKPLRVGTHTLIAQVDVLKSDPDGKFVVFNRYSRRVSVQVGVSATQRLINAFRNGESVGDALTAFLKSMRGIVIAFVALIAAIFGGWFLLRKRAREKTPLASGPNDDALADEPASH